MLLLTPAPASSCSHCLLKRSNKQAQEPLLCCLAGDDLLQDEHVRIFVADLPPKYNVHTIAKEGCKSEQLSALLANPLGPLIHKSLSQALYR